MATIQQQILDYNLHFVHNRATGQSSAHFRTRFIHARFGPDSNNFSLLILGFIADTQSATTGDITKLANGSYRVSARIPVGEFSAYSDLLRNERPVSVWIDYGTEPAIGQSVPVTNFSLFTGPEPLGEGPKDASV